MREENKMPTWYDYEREADEMDEEFEKEKRKSKVKMRKKLFGAIWKRLNRRWIYV